MEAVETGARGAARLMVRFETRIALAVGAAYTLLYAVLSVLRHRTYHSYGNDLGLFDQVFWNTVQGRPFQSTASLGIPQPHSFLGDHFSPVYGLLLPFYRLLPHPETLVVLQAVAFGLGALPIYLLARARAEPGWPRLAWVVVYFLFLPVAFISLFDFHETAFAVLPLGLALYFAETGRGRWMLLSLAASFLVKEEMPLIGLGFGAYVVLGKRRAGLGLATLLLSAGAFAAIIGVVIPAFAGGRQYAYVGTRYGDLGTSWSQILTTVITRPLRVAAVVLQPKKLAFLAGIFGPVLGASVLSGWGVVLLLPTLAYLLLSNYAPQYSFATQYAAPLIPLVLGTAIVGVGRLGPRSRARLTVAIVLSSLVLAGWFGDLPFSRKFDWSQFRAEPRYAAFAPALDRIPASASVSAENNLTPHLSQRFRVYTLEYEGTQNADYVALDEAATGHDPARFRAQVAWAQAQGYEVVASGDGLALLRRVAPSP
jgi:uncharacterized membrane protein